jgi:cytochrome P450
MDAIAPGRTLQPRPPVPAAPLPFFAFLRAIRRNALTMWPEAAYQEEIVERKLLGRSNFLLNAPDAIRQVLVDNPGNYRRSSASVRILRPITGRGLLLSEGEEWRLQRRTTAPALAPRVMPMLARHIVSATDEAVGVLTAQAGQPVDLLAAMQNLALEIAGRSMFSLETRQYGAAMRAQLTEYGQRFAQAHLLDMMLPPSIPTPRDFGRRRFQVRWMALMDSIMQARMAAPASDVPRDLFDLLLAARDPETGAAFSHEQLRDQVATLILAGHETTAVTLFWALTLLARSPAEQQYLADEVRDLDLQPETAAAAMAQLPYTRAVVNETLRLYPPAFTMAREAIGADRLLDREIKPGTVLMIAPWVLHHHRLLWREPDLFDPTRFLPPPGSSPGTAAPTPPRFSYLPFGTGPRVCVGAQFALTEATLVLASIVRSFHVELIDTTPILPAAIVTTQPDHAPRFRLHKRN